MNALHVEAGRLHQRLAPLLEPPAVQGAQHALRDVWRHALQGRIGRAVTRLAALAEPTVPARPLTVSEQARRTLLALCAIHVELHGAWKQVASARARVRLVEPTAFGLRTPRQPPIQSARDRASQGREVATAAASRHRALASAMEKMAAEVQRALDGWLRELAAAAAELRALCSWRMADEEKRLAGLLTSPDADSTVDGFGLRLRHARDKLGRASELDPGRFGPLLRSGWLAIHHQWVGWVGSGHPAA